MISLQQNVLDLVWNRLPGNTIDEKEMYIINLDNDRIKIPLMNRVREYKKIREFVDERDQERRIKMFVYGFYDDSDSDSDSDSDNNYYDNYDYIIKYKLVIKYFPEYINLQDNESYNALILASVTDKIDLVQLLIDNNANLDVQDNFGYNALHHAVRYNNFNVVKLLVNNGINLNTKTLTGETALDFAIFEEHNNIEQFLRNNNAKKSSEI